MNILHINTFQTAGAALCAIRINEALQNEGIDSRMLLAQGTDMPKGIKGTIAEEDKDFWHSNCWLLRLKYLLARTPLWRKMDKEKVEMILRRKNNHLSPKLYLHGPYTSYKNIAHHPLVEWADVIHLHWVACFVDYPTFFKEVKKPIVWTLHDIFPAVGALHFESEFYPVPDSLKEIDTFCRKVKRESVLQTDNLNIVAISKQMADVCKKSDVLKGFPIKLIHNGVDIDIFRPYDKKETRAKLGLPEDATIFLFSANSLDDENKGLIRLIIALNQLRLPNILLVCVGSCHSEYFIPDASFPINVTGYVDSQEKMAEYYSASDFFLQCSYVESFGQTIIEAMACGIPVVSTPCGVAPELIQSFNGVLCEGYEAEALASGIKKAITNDFNSDMIRQYICNNFQYKDIAGQYVNLYESILKDDWKKQNA